MQPIWETVRLEGLGISLPAESVTTTEIEQRLKPLYERLGLAEGRLELLTGIRERRFFPPGYRPSQIGIEAGRRALEKSQFPRERIGCLIYSAVCRDFVEPATATVIHQGLGLASDCEVFDLSNACLGFLSGMGVIADRIALGQIEAGMVVCGEDGRALVESTIRALNSNTKLNRKTIKKSIASLTIGSGGVAVILSHRDLSQTPHRLIGSVTEVATQHHKLCQGGTNASENTRQQITMATDSETMLHEGVALAKRAWQRLRGRLPWEPSSMDHIVTHQVGEAHRQMLYKHLELDLDKDYSTFEYLGNMGSASVGVTLAERIRLGHLQSGNRLLLMGIGSGLVCTLMGVEW